MRLFEITGVTPPLATIPQERLDALRADGHDVDEALYHGSRVADLKALDGKFAVTAQHIYTAPDAETASAYGDHLYLCVGRQAPQADLIEDHRLLGKLAETFYEYFLDAVEPDENLQALKAQIAQRLIASSDDPDYDETEAGWDAEKDPEYIELQKQLALHFAAQVFQSGDVYSYDHRGRLQDSLMHECFGMGYKSVRFYDASQSGESVSVVFKDGTDLELLKQLR